MFLGLITQRPAELDATIISQCSTLFAMRMANERDQAIVRSAVSDAAAILLAFVPSLGTREVFAFGEGVALPTRLQVQGAARAPDPAQPGRHQCDHRSSHDRDRGLHRHDHRPLARRDHEPKQIGLEADRTSRSLARDEFSSLSVAPQAPSVPPPPTSAAPAQPAARPGPLQLLKRPIEGAATCSGAASRPARRAGESNQVLLKLRYAGARPSRFAFTS